MDGIDHVQTAPLVAVPVAAISAGGHPLAIATCIGAAYLTAGGWLSPDADQTWLRWMPGGHRGLTHWWALPAALWLAADRGWMPYAQEPAALGLWLGLAAGWLAHILGDLFFGKAHGRRPPGVPLAPWWWYLGLDDFIGLTLRSGGTIAHWFAGWPTRLLVAWEVAWWATGDPLPLIHLGAVMRLAA